MSYTVNISENNQENDFYTAIIDIKIKEDHIHNSCVYNDIDDEK